MISNRDAKSRRIEILIGTGVAAGVLFGFSGPAKADNYVVIPNAAISGHNHRHVTGVTPAQCMDACSNETGFFCQSFDYYKLSNECDLSAMSASDVGGLKTDYVDNPFDHYARTTHYARVPNAAISGHNHKHLTGVTVAQCEAACSNEASFVCKSFDYYKASSECDLSAMSASDVGGLKTDYAGHPFDHYARGATGIPHGWGYVCSLWDGSVPAIGSYLRFLNTVVKDTTMGPANYRTDLAGRYLVNTWHGGEPVPKFVGEDEESSAALYQVVDSRFTSSGPEVMLQSPAEGLAADSDVGFNGAQLITSEHSYWPINSRWIRLAHQYWAWTNPNCGSCAAQVNDKAPPIAVLQRPDGQGHGHGCYQEWGPVYQFTSCDDYYVSFGGHGGEQHRELARYASDVQVEVCSPE